MSGTAYVPIAPKDPARVAAERRRENVLFVCVIALIVGGFGAIGLLDYMQERQTDAVNAAKTCVVRDGWFDCGGTWLEVSKVVGVRDARDVGRNLSRVTVKLTDGVVTVDIGTGNVEEVIALLGGAQ